MQNRKSNPPRIQPAAGYFLIRMFPEHSRMQSRAHRTLLDKMQDHPQKIRKEAHFSTTMLSRMNRVGTVPVQIHRQSRSLHTTAVIAMVSRQVNRVPMRTSRQIQNPAKAINGTMRITTSRHQSSQPIKTKRIKIKGLKYLLLSCAQSFVPV